MLEDIHEQLARHRHGAQALQVVGMHLAIQQPETALMQRRAQSGERRLGGIGAPAEHGFPEKDLAYDDAIQSPRQPFIIPTLHGQGLAEIMQMRVGLDDFGGDPGFGARMLLARATDNHLPEGLVTGNAVARLPQGLAQAAGDLDLVRLQYATRIGRPPQDGLSGAEPGEDAAAIGAEQSLGREIAADGQQTVRFFQGAADRRKILRDQLIRHPEELATRVSNRGVFHWLCLPIRLLPITV